MAVYLAYAERAAHGHWFQFNPGEVSAGVTSPGYLALLTLIYRAADPSAVPVLVKALNFAAWYGLAFVVWRLGRVLLGNPQTAAMVGLVAAAIPGSCYNATVGMENGVFALALVLGVWAATGRDLRPAPAAREALEGLLWGAAIWLRPEGIVAAGLWFSCRAIALRSAAATARRGDSWRLAAGALIAGLSWGALLAFHYAASGALIPASARARTWLTTLERVQVGPLSLDPKFGLRLLA